MVIKAIINIIINKQNSMKFMMGIMKLSINSEVNVIESKGNEEKLLKTGVHGCSFVGLLTQLRSQTKALKSAAKSRKN